MAAAGSTPDGPVSIDIDIEDGRTTITVTGTREAAVVVWSASGERVYLPPEQDAGPDGDSPYQPAEGDDGPYDGVPDDTPYGPAEDRPSVGLNKTANGFRIIHPEPVTDVRVLR